MLLLLNFVMFCGLPQILLCVPIEKHEIHHGISNDGLTIHILEVQPLVKPEHRITEEHITADAHTIHEVLPIIPLTVTTQNLVLDGQKHKLIPVTTLVDEPKHPQKVHPVINLIPNEEEAKLAIIKVEPKKVTVTVTSHSEDDKLQEAKSVKSREKKAYPLIQHVLIPTNIHAYFPVQPVQDLRVIPLRREGFRNPVETYNDYEPNVFRTYYGGFGNGLNFGGHGAGHGFYTYV